MKLRSTYQDIPLEFFQCIQLLQDLIDWEIDQAIQPGTVVKLGEEDNATFCYRRYIVTARYGGIILLYQPGNDNPLRLNYDTLRGQLNMRPACDVGQSSEQPESVGLAEIPVRVRFDADPTVSRCSVGSGQSW